MLYEVITYPGATPTEIEESMVRKVEDASVLIQLEKPVVGGNHETTQRVADAIFKALENAAPERLTAGSATTSGLLLFGGTDPRTGLWTTL